MKNIILTGFMGTGKTAIGRIVAQQTGATFIDMDAEIESRAGKSIPQIFSEDGEETFRHMERSLCEELSARDALIVATGGGALVDPVNRSLMLKSGIVFCLNCNVDEILRRVSAENAPERPLLHTADPRAEIGRLLADRNDAYKAIPWQIDTSSIPIVKVADQIVALASATTRSVHHPAGSYQIQIGAGLLSQTGLLLQNARQPSSRRIAVVSNTTVAPLYAARILESLNSTGYSAFLCTIPDGEQFKTLNTMNSLYDQFLSQQLDRSGIVLALGGGVTGDIAGFAAATFMRGVRFVQAPTTLLAMVDSSVGGKTGVDLPQGKNLVGAFKQPVLVVIDPDILQTLDPAEIRSGLAETIKHGVIGDADFFRSLEDSTEDMHIWWNEAAGERIARAVEVKIAIVQEDPFEGGQRAVLNLGHTTAHALEKLSNFTLRHGEAVSIGLCAAARIGVELGITSKILLERIESTLTKWSLPTRCPAFEAAAIWDAMAHDKKRRGRTLRWILIHDIGDVHIHEDVPTDLVQHILVEMGAKPAI